MFAQKLKPFGILAFVSISLFWIADGVAQNLPKQAENTLPYVEIKKASNLVADAEEANKKQLPILMFFSMKHCPFCIEVEEDYLKPMLRNSEYDDKIIIRKIRIDGTDSLVDFNGKERDVEELGDDYNVSMVPTLILVNAKGKKIAPPIIGIANAHYYSDELDKAIARSTQKIRALARH